MIEDLAKFEGRKVTVQKWYQDIGKERGISYSVGAASDFTGCPCIVVAYWIGEMENWSEESLKNIKGLMDFYRYTEILNKPTGAPV